MIGRSVELTRMGIWVELKRKHSGYDVTPTMCICLSAPTVHRGGSDSVSQDSAPGKLCSSRFKRYANLSWLLSSNRAFGIVYISGEWNGNFVYRVK